MIFFQCFPYSTSTSTLFILYFSCILKPCLFVFPLLTSPPPLLLLPQVDVLELLGQHHGRWVWEAVAAARQVGLGG